MKFSKHPAYLAYKHPQKEKVLKFIELMYGKDSELIHIVNMDERKLFAERKSAKIVEDDAFKILRHAFLTDQNHNKHRNLVTFQQMLWNVQRDAMDNFDVLKYDKAVDVMIKLEKEIAALLKEIYVDSKSIEVAKEQIKQVKSAEERLVETKKV